MKLISLTCPHCGGALEISEDAKQANCPFCDSTVIIDDEVKPIRFSNTEQAGYDFEKGRLKAQQDAINVKVVVEQNCIPEQQEAESKKKRTGCWVLIYIFLFPVFLTILIAKSEKLKTVWKIILIVVLWAAILFIGLSSNNRRSSASAITMPVIVNLI